MFTATPEGFGRGGVVDDVLECCNDSRTGCSGRTWWLVHFDCEEAVSARARRLLDHSAPRAVDVLFANLV